MASLNSKDLGRILRVEFDYKYKANDGRLIKIEVDEEFVLIKKSNDDWWQVIKEGVKKPFYIPATYVKETSRLYFPDHVYFKKASSLLDKTSGKNESSTQVKPALKPKPLLNPTLRRKEEEIANTNAKDVFSTSKNENKLSSLRASCESLDRFIENENPYDEVPFESTFSRPSKKTKSSMENDDDHEYANLETVTTQSASHQQTAKPLVPSKEHINQLKNLKNKRSLNNDDVEVIEHRTVKPVYANLGNKDGIRPRLPTDLTERSFTTVEILDDGWELQLDNQTNSKYYLNTKTGEMRIKPPRRAVPSLKTPENSHKYSSPQSDPTKQPKLTYVPSYLSKFSEKKPFSLERRRTLPARIPSNAPTASSSDENEKPLLSLVEEDSRVLQAADPGSKEAFRTKSNGIDRYFSFKLFHPTEKKKQKVKHKKSKSDSDQLSSHDLVAATALSSSGNTVGGFDEPAGWSIERDTDGDVVFVRESNGERWREMVDEKTGKFYYFNEHTQESSWKLPQEYMSCILESGAAAKLKAREEIGPHSLSLPRNTSPSSVRTKSRTGGFFRQVNRIMHARSLVLLSRSHSRTSVDDAHQRKTPLTPEESFPASTVEAPLPHPMIERQGRLQCTKLMEAGKKQRKNWLQQWVVLLANNLLFYKDQKQANMSKTLPHGKPNSSCSLHGAFVDWAKDKSSKKFVIELQTLRGLSLLLQDDDIVTMNRWLVAIKATIEKANQHDPVDTDFFAQKNSAFGNEDEEVDPKKKKDKKKKQKPIRHGSDAKNPDSVRYRLLKLINRRPTFESLQERGIIKETVFGCNLAHLCQKEQTTVPNFIRLCVEEVERRGLDVDGIYRISGNLSHIQKLRYLIDRDEPVNLSDPQWEDIHVVAGALKMFLRELPEPVFPFNVFDKFVDACKIQDEYQKIYAMKNLVQSLPKANGDTLQYLMKHFCNVVEHSSNNRMQVQNIAIILGPTLLLKPPCESRLDVSMAGGEMAVFMVYQNQIVDLMLTEYNTIFA